MNRLILAAGILLVLLVGLERTLTNQREAARRLASTIRPLLGTENRTADSVHILRATFRGTTWTYRLIEDIWRYPADHNAFVLAEPLERVINGVIDARGTPIVNKHPTTAHYGLDKSQRLTIDLTDATHTWTQTVHIGRSLPGKETQEAYMRAGGNDTLFHAHTDPRPIFLSRRIPGRPPLIDPKVLPSALERQSIVHIAFMDPGNPVQNLRRIEIEQKKEASPKPQDGPIYEWHATIQNRTRKVSNTAVYAYLGFLRRLQYDALLDPAQHTANKRRDLVLTDDAGISDTLSIGPQLPNGYTVVRNHTAIQLMSISTPKTTLVFPSESLLDSLPKPSPYDSGQSTAQ